MPYYSRIVLNSFCNWFFPKLLQHNRRMPYLKCSTEHSSWPLSSCLCFVNDIPDCISSNMLKTYADDIYCIYNRWVCQTTGCYPTRGRGGKCILIQVRLSNPHHLFDYNHNIHDAPLQETNTIKYSTLEFTLTTNSHGRATLTLL